MIFDTSSAARSLRRATDERLLETETSVSERERIVDVGERLMRRFGHRKTTVADIASDLRTSRANLGVSLVGPTENSSPEEASWVFNANVLGPLRLIRAVLPSMRAQKSGLIINVSSVLSFRPAPFMGIHAATKHALEGMSESPDHEIR